MKVIIQSINTRRFHSLTIGILCDSLFRLARLYEVREMAIITVKELAESYLMHPGEIRRILRSNGYSVGRGKRYKWEESDQELVQVREAISNSRYSWRLTPEKFSPSFEQVIKNLFGWIFECRDVEGPGTSALRCFLKRLPFGLPLLPVISLYFLLMGLWKVAKRNAFTRKGLITFSIAVVVFLPTEWVMNGIFYPFAVYLFFEFIVWLFRFVFGSGGWEHFPGYTPQAKVGKLRRGIKRGRRIF